MNRNWMIAAASSLLCLTGCTNAGEFGPTIAMFLQDFARQAVAALAL